MDQFFATIASAFIFLANISVINNLLLLAFFVAFGIFILKESQNDDSPMHWRDMVMDKAENRMSLIKVGQFFGIVISNWAIITLIQQVKPDQVAGLLPILFPMWLTFIIGGWAYSSYLKTSVKSSGLTDDTAKSTPPQGSVPVQSDK